MKKFDVKTLIDTATVRTGLSDFGEPDCMDNLNALVTSVNKGAKISDESWAVVSEYFVRILVNRLWFAKDLTENPEILEQSLLPPAIILGLPRTGSTKLQRMLSVADNFQSLPWWEMHMFARIPGVANGGVAERIRVTKEFEQWCYTICPDMVKGHPRYAEAPEEEQILNECTFVSGGMAIQFGAQDYTGFLMNADMQEVYSYMEMQLKYLQWQFHKDNVKPWLLKSPSHLGFENNIVNTFGREIKIINAHRDPVKIVCSIAKTVKYYREMYSGKATQAETEALGHMMLGGLVYAITKNMAWRDKNPGVQVLDLSFQDVNKDSGKVLGQVHEFMGIELTPNVEVQVKSWDTDQQGTHINNEYSPEEFGLSEALILAAFEPYLERFAKYIYS